MLASIARLRFADKGIINLWTDESKASIIERQGVRYLVVSPLGSTPTPCDLAFVCKVLGFDLGNMLNLLRGFVDEALYWSDELPKFTVRPVDPERDSGRHARRMVQAQNYCALHSDRWIGAVLMSVLDCALLIIDVTEGKAGYHSGRNGPPLPTGLPAEPLDYLFLVGALDYALRPDGPVRRMIQAHESGHVKRSEDV